MGNCIKEVSVQPFEIQQTQPRASMESAVPTPDIHVRTQSSHIGSPVDQRSVHSSSSQAMRSDHEATELSKSIDNLAKQLDQSRMWQEAKFSHVMAETRLLEAKMETLKRKSLEAGLVTVEERSSEVSQDYLEIEKELEHRMGVIMGQMGSLKSEVETLATQAKELSSL